MNVSRIFGRDWGVRRGARSHSGASTEPMVVADVFPASASISDVQRKELLKLAGEIHSLLCDNVPRRCGRWQPGMPHWDFYHLRAENLMVELTPICGMTRVREVVRICISELNLLVYSVFLGGTMSRSMIYQQGFDHGFAIAIALLRGERGESCTIVIPPGISHKDRHHFLDGVADGIRNVAYSATLHFRVLKPEDNTGEMLWMSQGTTPASRKRYDCLTCPA